MKELYIILILTVVSWTVHSQDQDPQFKDPQNMKVEPQHTDCHKLPEVFENLSEAISVLESTRFYYDQSIKTTRRSGLMRARYLSCDFKTGFLLIHYNGEDLVYPNIETQLWEQFQQTADIDGFYFKHIEQLPKIESE